MERRGTQGSSSSRSSRRHSTKSSRRSNTPTTTRPPNFPPPPGPIHVNSYHHHQPQTIFPPSPFAALSNNHTTTIPEYLPSLLHPAPVTGIEASLHSPPLGQYPSHSISNTTASNAAPVGQTDLAFPSPDAEGDTEADSTTPTSLNNSIDPNLTNTNTSLPSPPPNRTDPPILSSNMSTCAENGGAGSGMMADPENWPEYPHSAYNYGTWTSQEDKTLVSARNQGHHWATIQKTHFPAKTANACRKRYERLMERRGIYDLDKEKLEKVAHEYMGMRREIWSGLAARVGEKWSVVEAQCMSAGLKQIQVNARSHARRQRQEIKVNQRAAAMAASVANPYLNTDIPPGVGVADDHMMHTHGAGGSTLLAPVGFISPISPLEGQGPGGPGDHHHTQQQHGQQQQQQQQHGWHRQDEGGYGEREITPTASIGAGSTGSGGHHGYQHAQGQHRHQHHQHHQHHQNRDQQYQQHHQQQQPPQQHMTYGTASSSAADTQGPNSMEYMNMGYNMSGQISHRR